jgi:Transposase DDE domain
VKVDDEEVTEYYHRGVVCHLIGQDLAIPLDVEFQQPDEGEVPAAKRLLERVFANYSRYFDGVVGDGLYFEAPFINFCLKHHKDVIVVVKGDHRLLLQDAERLFSQRPNDGQWSEGRRTIQYWDEEDFTSAEGVSQPLRVLHTIETERCRERIARQWKETEKTSSWYWATTFSKQRLPVRNYWLAGHWRWDVENDCFNTTSAHWGLDHVYKHDPTAIVNFVLTLFLAFVLLQCFWRRNLKPALRAHLTLIGLADELYAALTRLRRGHGIRIPQARAP